MAATRPTTNGHRPPEAPPLRRTAGWVDERLDLTAAYRKYGRKVFPVHSTFFLGEMCLFAFLILVVTGAYLGFIYVPSSAEVTVNGETLPEAYASVRLIESIPIASLFRNTHIWAAHVMIASIVLHLLRIFFTGTYRKPREINWIVGVVLLAASLAAGFVGYALPYDAFAVTATGIGYAIARSIPWVGEFSSELIFGGAFPSLGSLARLYTIHVFILPAIITGVTALHLLITTKQKHSQPGYARRLAEPGKVLGVPLIPYQGLIAGQLLLLMFGMLFLLSAFVSPHSLEEYGPPRPETPEVKPDWYLLWVYGFLKIVPTWASFEILGGSFGANFFGGLLFPGLIFGILTLAPWMDSTNRKAVRTFQYLEPLQQSPFRTASGFAMLAFLGTLYLAAYYDEIGMTLGQIWMVVGGVPLVVGVATALVIRARMPAPEDRFDPRESLVAIADADVTPQETESFAYDRSSTSVVGSPLPSGTTNGSSADGASTNGHSTNGHSTNGHAPNGSSDHAGSNGGSAGKRSSVGTMVNQGERSRDTVVETLHELGELAAVVRQLDDKEELLHVLQYVDTLRANLADSNETLKDSVATDPETKRP